MIFTLAMSSATRLVLNSFTLSSFALCNVVKILLTNGLWLGLFFKHCFISWTSTEGNKLRASCVSRWHMYSSRRWSSVRPLMTSGLSGSKYVLGSRSPGNFYGVNKILHIKQIIPPPHPPPSNDSTIVLITTVMHKWKSPCFHVLTHLLSYRYQRLATI